MAWTPPNTFVNGTTADATAVDANFAGAGSIGEYADNIAAATGTNSSGVVRRGKSIIDSAESRTNVALGTLPTPDRVQNIIVPAYGLLKIRFIATWQESVAGAGLAAIVLGTNQLKIPRAAVSSVSNQSASIGASYTPGNECLLTSTPSGLRSLENMIAGGGAAPVYQTTGQVLGGGVRAATNPTTTYDHTYGYFEVFFDNAAPLAAMDISVQFLASSGSVTVRKRRLWVEAISF